MGVWLGPRSRRGIKEEELSYNGNYLFASDKRGNWEIALLTSGVLSFSRDPGRVDIFMVGSGQTAQPDWERNAGGQFSVKYGGIGGAGGETITRENLLLSTNGVYTITIGIDQTNNKDTKITGNGLNLIAQNGAGLAGGKGGMAAQIDKSDAPQAPNGVYAYEKETDTLMFTEEEFQGHLFGAPGGGGGSTYPQSGQYTAVTSTGALGGESNGPQHQYGKGGNSGQYERNGTNGYDKHGQGGGGPYYYWSSGAQKNEYGDGTSNAFGKGGSGIIFIRNHRS